MTDVELLVEWIEDFARDMRAVVEALPPEALAWQPGPRSNNIAVTVWHCARWLDLLGQRALQDAPAEAELWHAHAWAAQTGYHPRGHGSKGLGLLTGYTWEEVLEIPILPAGDLLTYLDQACQALAARLAALPRGGLHQLAPGLGGRRTPYGWVKPILQGCFGHLGEVEAIKARWEKRG